MATPTKQASVVTNPGGTGSSIVPTLPTHAANDEIEIWVAKTGNVAWSAPAGWTIRHQVSSPGSASTATQGTLLYRRVLSTDTLPLSSPTCNLGATVTRHAIARTIRGADIEGVYTTPSWSATATGSGTANPIRPASVTTSAPEMLVTHYYCQRLATNAPEPSGYTQDQEVITSGTLVTNISEKNVADQNTALANQDASPTSGGRWAAVITCAPSIDYPYYRSGSQATATATSVTPALPPGTTATDQRGNKDLIIATVEAAGTAPSPNTPADWTEIASWSTTTDGGATTVRRYWALYDGSLDRQFNRTGSGEISVCLTTYYNAHQTTPIGNSDADPRATSTTSTWDAVNRSNTKVVVTATCVADATPSFTAPAGWIERMDGLGIICADQTYDASGSAASASFTLSAGSPTLVGLVEIKGIASEAGPEAGLTGVSATGAVGTLASERAVALSGVSATGEIGSFGITKSGSLALTGVSSSAATGSFGISTDTPLSGNEATANAGSLSFTESGSAGLTNVLATGSAGTLSPDTSVAITGNEATASVGILTPNQVTGAALTGVEATTFVGTLTPAISVALTGNESTVGVGSLAVSASVSISGDAATGSVGDLSPSSAQALTGVSGTADVGTLTQSTTVGLTGIEVTGAAGSVSASSPGSAALTGVEAIGSAGDLGITKSGQLALTGVSATGAVGTLTVSISSELTGTEATTAVGNITATADSSASLSGVVGSGETGTLGVSVTAALSGVQANTDVGSLSLPSPGTVGLTGVQAAGQVGNLSAQISPYVRQPLSVSLNNNGELSTILTTSGQTKVTIDS